MQINIIISFKLQKLQRVGLHLKFSLVIWNSKIKISKILNSLNWVEFPNSEFPNLNQNSKMCIRIPKVGIPKFRIIKYEFSKSGIWDFEILRFCDFEIYRFWDLWFWDFEILRFWDLNILRFIDS